MPDHPTTPTPVNPAAEAEAVQIAEGAATAAAGYISNAPAGRGGVAQAYALLAVAASIDALRVALTDRLDMLDDLAAAAQLRG